MTLSYSYIYQGYTVNSGSPKKPKSVNIEVSWCDRRIDLFSVPLSQTPNVTWQTRTISASMLVCQNEFVPFIFKVSTDPNAKSGDYTITMGIDNIQYNP